MKISVIEWDENSGAAEPAGQRPNQDNNEFHRPYFVDKDGVRTQRLNVNEAFSMVFDWGAAGNWDRMHFSCMTSDLRSQTPLVIHPYTPNIPIRQLVQPQQVGPEPFQAGDRARLDVLAHGSSGGWDLIASGEIAEFVEPIQQPACASLKSKACRLQDYIYLAPVKKSDDDADLSVGPQPYVEGVGTSIKVGEPFTIVVPAFDSSGYGRIAINFLTRDWTRAIYTQTRELEVNREIRVTVTQDMIIPDREFRAADVAIVWAVLRPRGSDDVWQAMPESEEYTFVE